MTGSHDSISSTSSAIMSCMWKVVFRCPGPFCVTFYIFNLYQAESLDTSYLERLSVLLQPTQGPEGDL